MTHWLLSFSIKKAFHPFLPCLAHFSPVEIYIACLCTEELFVIVSLRPKFPISDNSRPLSIPDIRWRQFCNKNLNLREKERERERERGASSTVPLCDTSFEFAFERDVERCFNSHGKTIFHESILSKFPSDNSSPIIFAPNLHKHSYPGSKSRPPPPSEILEFPRSS